MKKINVIAIVLLAAVFAACGGSGGSGNGGGARGAQNDYVNWKSIPNKYNPVTKSIQFQVKDVSQIEVSLFGFSEDFRIVYSDKLDFSLGTLEVYSVSHGNVRYGISEAELKYQGDVLKFYRQGGYECSIQIENGNISALEGACYVRIVMTLPTNSQIEVYNAGTLVSARFKAQSNDKLLENIDRAAFSKEKFLAIDDYLESYRAIQSKPILNTKELGAILGEFTWKNEKYDVLRKLHIYVTDRENFGQMINDNFSTFERDEARKIVGLN